MMRAGKKEREWSQNGEYPDSLSTRVVGSCLHGWISFAALKLRSIDLPVPVDGIFEEEPGNDAASAGLAH